MTRTKVLFGNLQVGDLFALEPTNPLLIIKVEPSFRAGDKQEFNAIVLAAGSPANFHQQGEVWKIVRDELESLGFKR